MAAPPPIAVIGNANLDILGGPLAPWPEPGTESFLDRSDQRIGGSAANTAWVLQRLGAPAGLIATAGTDLIGDMIAQGFSGPLDRITRIDAPSSVTFGLLHPDAERTFFSTRGHLDLTTAHHLTAPLEGWPCAGALALVSGSFAMPALEEATSAALDDLAARGARTAIDPGWPGDGWTAATRAHLQDWIARADVVLLNDKELLGLAGTDSLDRALDTVMAGLRPGGCLVVKRGAAGALSRDTAGVQHEAAAPRAEVLDTIGAGDAFNAGYLAALQAGRTPRAALEAGCRIATQVIAAFPRETTCLTLPHNTETP